MLARPLPVKTTIMYSASQRLANLHKPFSFGLRRRQAVCSFASPFVNTTGRLLQLGAMPRFVFTPLRNY